MRDINSEEDIKTLIDKFYQKVVADPVIGFIFTEVVVLSWEKHIPIMYKFWSSVLLGSNTYSGNTMLKHIELDQKIKLEQKHFDRWLGLWENTVKENFAGRIADEAVTRAKNIALVIQHHVSKE